MANHGCNQTMGQYMPGFVPRSIEAFNVRQGSRAIDALVISTAIAALAELGDKSQLLVLTLAVRYRRPLPIIVGIVTATALNHAAAGSVGSWIGRAIDPLALRLLCGAAFIGIALWVWASGRNEQAVPRSSHYGVFATTALSFFVMEIGDKTQIATLALAARYPLWEVVIGTTSGILLADVPVVLFAARLRRLPGPFLRRTAAAMFLVLGVLALGGFGLR